MNKDLVEYYALRAAEYEAIYSKPERQQDLDFLSKWLPNQYPNLAILELGCGTGYWTQFMSKKAEFILATDINEAVLDIARHKSLPSKNVSWQQHDMYSPLMDSQKFDAGFAGFVWSHVSIDRFPQLLQIFHSHLKPGARVIWMDNVYVEGSNTPIAEYDELGNSYQHRKLSDGTSHRVMKNFPTDEIIKSILSKSAEHIRIQRLLYYWTVSYTIFSSEL